MKIGIERKWIFIGPVAWYRDELVGLYGSEGERSWFHLSNDEAKEYKDCYRLPILNGYDYLMGSAPTRGIHDYDGLRPRATEPKEIIVTDIYGEIL